MGDLFQKNPRCFQFVVFFSANGKEYLLSPPQDATLVDWLTQLKNVCSFCPFVNNHTINDWLSHAIIFS